MAKGGGGVGCFPESICLLFMLIHIITALDWRHVHVALVLGDGSKSGTGNVLFAEEIILKHYACSRVVHVSIAGNVMRS